MLSTFVLGLDAKVEMLYLLLLSALHFVFVSVFVFVFAMPRQELVV